MKKCCYLATDGSALQNREDVEMIRFFECIGGIFINLLWIDNNVILTRVACFSCFQYLKELKNLTSLRELSFLTGFFSLFPLAFRKFPWTFLKFLDFGFRFLSFWLCLPGLNQRRPEAEGDLGRGDIFFLLHNLFTFFTHWRPFKF